MLFTERRANHGVWPIEIDHHRGSRDMNEERKFIIDGQEVHAEVERSGNTLKIKIEGELHEVSLNETQRVSKANFKGRSAKRRTNQSTGSIVSTIPGKIVSIDVNVGDVVTAGQTILILEAMKMQNEISSEINGTVRDIYVIEGDSVEANFELVKIEPEPHD